MLGTSSLTSHDLLSARPPRPPRCSSPRAPAGKRFVLPHARILIHQRTVGHRVRRVDIAIQAKEITRMRELLDNILAHHTGQEVEKIRATPTADFIMSALEARDYGIVDE